MSTTHPERAENPHRTKDPAPLLPRHDLRPAGLGTGLALAGLGCVFLLQQLGAITMGAAPTIAALVFAGAVVLIGLATGWSQRQTGDNRGPTARMDG